MLDFATIQFLADTLNDLEKTRIMANNRRFQLTNTKPDEDGKQRGQGLPEDHSAVHNGDIILSELVAVELGIVKSLEKAMKAHPLGKFITETQGIGLKRGARLLASIGDPSWNALHDKPRTLAQLWSYCGYSVVDGAAPKRAKGALAKWNPDARMRVYLIAESCLMNRKSPFRPVYDEGRLQYVEAVHKQPCVRCGPAGKPALVGSTLSDGHKHARAMRLMSKAILEDLWVEARALNGFKD